MIDRRPPPEQGVLQDAAHYRRQGATALGRLGAEFFHQLRVKAMGRNAVFVHRRLPEMFAVIVRCPAGF